MRKITLNNLAIMQEKTVMTVLAESKMAHAIITKRDDLNIYIDLDKYEAYLEKLIQEELKDINNY
jgi:hypothetical protein